MASYHLQYLQEGFFFAGPASTKVLPSFLSAIQIHCFYPWRFHPTFPVQNPRERRRGFFALGFAAKFQRSPGTDAFLKPLAPRCCGSGICAAVATTPSRVADLPALSSASRAGDPDTGREEHRIHTCAPEGASFHPASG